ncbi:NarL family two-component system sensor histidine kinase LiaS [Melghiribacillus thermohalophilus]|uniref:histidine kinase n=1 Tax=Melghiribacillus thermohalophilus TaxID=1324956 RepID=A0A4R3N9L6_9BACI|nr:sensor histidine kinase [Melghiribacillus thermohalophilus]TCT23679.1 NarL family two-component system sensor histidine kinase LiaS [Melghiribacillus thermohalophilus]
MLKKINSIRFHFIRAHLHTIYFSLLIIALTLFFVFSVFQPDWLTLPAIYLNILLMAGIMTPISVYISYKYSSDIKDRLTGISILISALSQGRYNAKIYGERREDEIDLISDKLGELAQKLQDQVRSLQRMAEEKSDYAKKARQAATMEERQRLARDLHDAVSQQLFALTMMSQATVKLLEKNPETAREQMEEIAQIALQAQTEMRALLLHLRPVHLSGETLQSGLTKLVDELKQKCQIQFKLEIGEELGLSRSKEEHLFRIVQEALSNILRHSSAEHVHIAVKRRSNEVSLYIHDDGKGFKVNEQLENKTSYGLKSMKERTQELGGSFAIRSKVGEGTYINIKIPLEGDEHGE